MTALSTHDPRPAEKPPTTKAFARSWVRGGLLRDLSWAEAFVLLQVAWGEPLRPHRVFDLEPRYRRRCLARLLDKGYIVKSEDGYSIHPEAYRLSDEKDVTTYVWLWPLKWGMVSVGARVAFILIDEQTRGRNWVNRSRLAHQMGVGRTTLYAYLEELEDAGFVLPWGKRTQNEKKLVLFNHVESLKDEILKGILTDPRYIRDDPLDGEEEYTTGRVTEAKRRYLEGRAADEHTEGRARTTRGSGANTRIHSGFPGDSPSPRRGSGEGEASPAKTWVEETAQHLAHLCFRKLKDNGAAKVPATRVLERDLLAALEPHRDTPPHRRTAFLKEVRSRAESCSSFMWVPKKDGVPIPGAGMLAEVLAVTSSASVHVVQDEKRDEQAAESLRASLLSLVEELQHAGLYDARLLAQPERLGALPRVKALTGGCVVAGVRGVNLPPAVVALDPVLGEALRLVG